MNNGNEGKRLLKREREREEGIAEKSKVERQNKRVEMKRMRAATTCLSGRRAT